MTQSDSLWAHCPQCKHASRFLRFEVNHKMHALFTVLTAGLWGISWIALIIGQRLHPWRCNQCGWNEPDLTRQLRSRSKKAGTSSETPEQTNADPLKK